MLCFVYFCGCKLHCVQIDSYADLIYTNKYIIDGVTLCLGSNYLTHEEWVMLFFVLIKVLSFDFDYIIQQVELLVDPHISLQEFGCVAHDAIPIFKSMVHIFILLYQVKARLIL
jgi:hypothetical protein